MKKLLGILVLGFLITSCSEYQNVSAPSKYTCGKSEDLIEIIGDDDSQQYLLIHSLKSRFGVFLKKDNMILEFSANNIDDMPTLFFQETNFNEGKCFLKYWRISKQQWDHIEVLINKAKELRKSDKGSEKHIYSERILVDILEGYKDTYSTKKIKPTLEVAFKLN